MDRHSKRISQEETEESLNGAPSSLPNPSQSSNNYSLNVISQRQPAALQSDSDDDITVIENGYWEFHASRDEFIPHTSRMHLLNVTPAIYRFQFSVPSITFPSPRNVFPEFEVTRPSFILPLQNLSPAPGKC